MKQLSFSALSRTVFAAAFAVALASAPSFAGGHDDSALYVRTDIGVLAVGDYCKKPEGATFTSCKDKKAGVVGRVGYRFGEYFGIETGGAYATGYDFVSRVGNTTFTGTSEYAAFLVGVRGFYNFSSRLGIEGHSGVHFWKQDFTHALPEGVALTEKHRNADENAYQGLGVNYRLTDNFSVNLDYTRFWLTSYDGDDSDFFSAGVKIAF